MENKTCQEIYENYKFTKPRQKKRTLTTKVHEQLLLNHNLKITISVFLNRKLLSSSSFLFVLFFLFLFILFLYFITLSSFPHPLLHHLSLSLFFIIRFSSSFSFFYPLVHPLSLSHPVSPPFLPPLPPPLLLPPPPLFLLLLLLTIMSNLYIYIRTNDPSD